MDGSDEEKFHLVFNDYYPLLSIKGGTSAMPFVMHAAAPDFNLARRRCDYSGGDHHASIR